MPLVFSFGQNARSARGEEALFFDPTDLAEVGAGPAVHHMNPSIFMAVHQ
jgi:hypothetical protein